MPQTELPGLSSSLEWLTSSSLHFTFNSKCSFSTRRAGPVTCASRDSTLECGSLRVGIVNLAQATIAVTVETTGLRWLNKTSPAVVVNQRAVEHNFTPVRSSTTAYCSGWVHQQQPPLLLPHNMDPAVEEQWQNSLCFRITGIFFCIILKRKTCLLVRFAEFIISIDGCSQNANPMLTAVDVHRKGKLLFIIYIFFFFRLGPGVRMLWRPNPSSVPGFWAVFQITYGTHEKLGTWRLTGIMKVGCLSRSVFLHIFLNIFYSSKNT